MAHHRKRVGYTVSAMHITRLSCDTESFSRTIALYDGNHFRRRAALVQQPPDPKASLEPKRDLDLHIDQLLLVELRVGKRTIELLAIQAVIARCKPTRSEEHTSELQSLMRISYAVFCLKKKK